MHKEYLGDGVYMEYDGGYEITLTAEYHGQLLGKVVLNPSMLSELVLYARRVTHADEERP